MCFDRKGGDHRKYHVSGAEGPSIRLLSESPTRKQLPGRWVLSSIGHRCRGAAAVQLPKRPVARGRSDDTSDHDTALWRSCFRAVCDSPSERCRAINRILAWRQRAVTLRTQQVSSEMFAPHFRRGASSSRNAPGLGRMERRGSLSR